MPRPASIPVFPLPNTVFFPDTCLPLHVFEPRYREMVRDAAAADRRIAIALLRPGWEADYDGRPPIHEIATLGRIDELVPLGDGRSNLRLVAESRVLLQEVPSDRSYRIARVERLPERGPAEHDGELRQMKLELLALHAFLMGEVTGERGDAIVLDESLSFAAAVNAVCACLPVEPERRQALLELDDLLDRQRQATSLVEGALDTLLRVRGLRRSDVEPRH